MEYGTAGFRHKYDIILKISERIGNIVVTLTAKGNKFYGIMITASHNDYCDNGVKIVNDEGFMISQEEEIIVTNYINSNKKINKSNYNSKIIIGFDTRFSSSIICQKNNRWHKGS